MRCCGGQACPTRPPFRGAGRGGSEACRRREYDGCACGGRSSERRLARDCAGFRPLRSPGRGPG
eukprot:6148406-Prymnesium_polylepis.1